MDASPGSQLQSPDGTRVDSEFVRSIVGAFERVLADRAERDTSLAEIDAELTGVRARLSTALETLESSQSRERAAHREQVENGRLEVRQEADRRRAEAERTLSGENERLTELHGAKIGRVEHQLREAVWLAETLYEANEEKPGDAYSRTTTLLSDSLTRLKRLDDDLAYILTSRRQRGVGKHPADGGIGPTLTLDQACDQAAGAIGTLANFRLARLFEGVHPVLFLLGAAMIGGVIASWQRGWAIDRPVWIACGVGALGAMVVGVILYVLARRRVRAMYTELCVLLRAGHEAHAREMEEAAAERSRAERALVEQRDDEIRRAKDTFGPGLDEFNAAMREAISQVEAVRDRDVAAATETERRLLDELQQTDEREAAAMQSRQQEAADELRRAQQRRIDELDAARADADRSMREAWIAGMGEARGALRRLNARCDDLFPVWVPQRWSRWSPPTEPPESVRFGSVALDLAQLPGGLPEDPSLSLDGDAVVALPALLDIPRQGSLLIDTDAAGRTASIAALQAVMVRLLTTFPPGQSRFTIIDPIGLGQSFAGFMHLADYDEALVSDRIWTESRHIEQRLTDLTEHMESVIQKYLRNEFETITAYNERAGEVAEPYRFLVIADFPGNFSESSARRLTSILHSGPRCGVFTLISRDAAQRLPAGITIDDLTGTCVQVTHRRGKVAYPGAPGAKLPFALEPSPPESLLTDLTKRIGLAAQESSRVEVPFALVTPSEEQIWSRDCSELLSVPIGRAGATKLQHLTLGRGTLQHALIAGKTGSGKSTLLHVLITNLASWFGPDEVQFYLVDFKKGVEFKAYASYDLPHACAIAIESEREFGLSVLQEVDLELRRRGERYRDLGVQDVAAFRERAPTEKMPRILLVIDEFQELFTEDDKVAQEANLLLDRLVRQGRAFGIHALLGSQTLGGAYTLARSTMGQMGIRIALQCSEADSYLILSEDNAAARLLGRPGEAIYNDASGLMEGNTPFQIVWLSERERDAALRRIAEEAERTGYERERPTVIFEGNAPADVARNALLRRTVKGGDAPGQVAQAWLGSAVAIKDPTAVVLERQSGSNLLIVGQREESVVSLLTVAMVGLGACDLNARFVVLDGTSDEASSRCLRRLGVVLPNHVSVVDGEGLSSAMEELKSELDRRRDGGSAGEPSVHVIVAGLHRLRSLRRRDDDFGLSSFGDESAPVTPERVFAELIDDGPSLGMHVMAWCDTASSLSRTIDRRLMRAFAHRVLFQMGQNDSSDLVDSVSASRLGEHRALLYSEDTGDTEKFHPYGRPPEEWLEWVEQTLGGRC